MRQVIIYPGEDGYWVAQCPSLPPCISQGKTKEEAITNIQEAIELYLEVLQEEGRAIPQDQVETVTLAI
ncbi:type II toxin-antitoxin system HicB family antitoxin [Cyanobacterium aponinum UTEX 3222]|uniref:type II toxin-antitoxin system HicB family antitoxin n=1 Tax=Cyanobacterium aponinum TaxID=379064 RepID=UPI002B4C1B52|nr:type II toxin-antitoxin system HicB family antitoxin [Cyanobacterium aponinum]WRL38190.1 type II toxin-antitoxin system HicB family antitoxin [Cyanobacterium aponinum UTEX 3221]WRL41323.1 type II toxin-antitoxin system HicB family antitoxin [Cyanobacterium aponinum UTEX 3222]